MNASEYRDKPFKDEFDCGVYRGVYWQRMMWVDVGKYFQLTSFVFNIKNWKDTRFIYAMYIGEDPNYYEQHVSSKENYIGYACDLFELHRMIDEELNLVIPEPIFPFQEIWTDSEQVGTGWWEEPIEEIEYE